MRKVRYVKLQATNAFIPEIGGLGDTLPPVNKSFSKFEMTTDLNVLFINVTSSKGVSAEAVIPLTNAQILVLEPEEKPAKGK